MSDILLAHGGPAHLVEGAATFGWLWAALAPTAAAIVGGPLVLWATGRGQGAVDRFASGASRLTGLPAWVAVPVLGTLGIALPTAGLGFYWDVAWHVDIGRDEFLFSPPHVALLTGLGALGVSGALGVWLATRERATRTWRAGPLRVPKGAAGLFVAGFVALAGFSFDEMWHWAYGLDVSMWGPTHLTMISAAAFAPLAVWTLLAEGREHASRVAPWRLLRWATAGMTVVGLSAWQLEFDLGVSQWQQLYHPVLVAAAAGFALTASRAALGRGGAIAAAAVAIAMRLLFVPVLSQLGLSVPRFPLYLGAAVAVEVAFVRARTAVRTALIAGVLVSTAGLAGAGAWTHVWAHHPWTTAFGWGALAAVVAAVAAALLGTAAGRTWAGRPSGVKGGLVAAAMLALTVAVIVPLPRHAPDLAVTIRTAEAAPGLVDVRVDGMPDALAANASRLEVFSWQGGGNHRSRLVQTAPGSYRTIEPAPTGGTWKTLVILASRDKVGAVPVFMPADPEIGAAAVPLRPERRAEFASLARTLQREAHAGPAWPGVVAYTWVFASIGTLLGVLAAGVVALDRRRRLGANAGPDVNSTAGHPIAPAGVGGAGAEV